MSEQARLTLTDGVELHVEIDGPEDAPITVVLLHGWCLDRRTWRHQIDSLAGRPVRIIAYDTRGHGRSGSTRLDGATLGQLGEDLGEVLQRFAPTGPIVLAGHSMGGMTIMEYAHRYPAEFTDRVAGLLFVSTTAEGHTHTSYGLPPRIASVLRAGETLGAGVLARSGPWRPHRAVLPALRPALRWLLFGEDISPEALHMTMRCVGRASLRSIGGFRASIGAQQRLDTLTQLGARLSPGARPVPAARQTTDGLPTASPGALPAPDGSTTTPAVLPAPDGSTTTNTSTPGALPTPDGPHAPGISPVSDGIVATGALPGPGARTSHDLRSVTSTGRGRGGAKSGGRATSGVLPSAVLVGDRDRLTPRICAESIAAALPGTGLTVFPGAGHMLPLERPEEVSAALSDVIERALQRSRPRTPRQRKLRRAA